MAENTSNASISAKAPRSTGALPINKRKGSK